MPLLTLRIEALIPLICIDVRTFVHGCRRRRRQIGRAVIIMRALVFVIRQSVHASRTL